MIPKIIHYSWFSGEKMPDIFVQLMATWKEHLQGEFDKPYFAQLTSAVRQEYAANVRNNLRSQLNGIDIQEKDGSIVNLGEKYGH